VSWVEIIKNALALAVLITQMIRDSQQRGLGRMETTNEALKNAQRDIAYASAVEEDAIRLTMPIRIAMRVSIRSL
jgi:hypothetical protein